VYQYIDAANVDLKAFTDSFYHKMTFSHLADVLDTLIWLKNETDVWLEITTLLIPAENDSDEELKQMCDWIVINLGETVPLHFTAFHPDFKLTNHVPTPRATLDKARKIALSAGIQYCYTGNIHDPDGQTTYCPGCKTRLIKRNWHTVETNIIIDGHCPECQMKIAGVGL